MKLLTHNMLTSPGNAKGFPLKIEAESVEEVETDFNAEFVARMVGKLEWKALLAAVKEVGITAQLPPEVPEKYEEDEEFLKVLHHVLLEVRAGDLGSALRVCPNARA